MVWRMGVVPDGSPPFPESLSGDLLDFGYGVLALALELRDANRTRVADARLKTTDAFEVAAEATRRNEVRSARSFASSSTCTSRATSRSSRPPTRRTW